MIPMGHKDKPWEEAQPRQRAESAPRPLGTGNLGEHRDERAMEGWDDRVQSTGGCRRPRGSVGSQQGECLCPHLYLAMTAAAGWLHSDEWSKEGGGPGAQEP